MITIQYDTTNDRNFSFLFDKKAYIPPSFYVKFPGKPELEFYKAIMDRHPKVRYVSEETIDYSIYCTYAIDQKEFVIVADEDYDLVYFSTESQNRSPIAEYLCHIIERHHAKSHFDLQ